jgi:predicted metalloprotease
MRWRRGERSADLQDRRGSRRIATGAAIGGTGIVAVIAALLFGVLGGGGGGDLGEILTQLGGAAQPAAQEEPLPGAPDPDAELVDFMSFVLDDVQATWGEIFADSGEQYQRTELIIFTGSTQSGCGIATSAVGPHYCPGDNNVYLDLDFFRELEQRFGAPGDFAQAYVLAHEIGHHVQYVAGIGDEVRSLQQSNPQEANELSVLFELQADCLAGVWAFTTFQRDILESGDLEEGLAAASAVGDDRIQEQTTGMINPETWTHGSSAQRREWFLAGFNTGDPSVCDTFEA